MKKLLALVLALVMTLSLATVSSNAAFNDADKVKDTYAEAVEVLTGMGVIKGYDDGSFKPEGSITRAEVAAVVYRIYTADVKDKSIGLYAGYSKFDDLTGANWAKGYIGYCANAELVRGYSATKFGPLDNVTGYQALAMILRAMGYDKNGEFTGTGWELHVAQTAQQLGILKNAGAEDLSAPASRQLVAELFFQAIQKDCVTYTPAFGYVANTIVKSEGSLGKKNFGLTKTDASNDKWGRPLYKWTNGKTGSALVTYATIKATPVKTYTAAVTECDVAHDAGLKVDTAYTLYVNGDKQIAKYIVNLTDTVTKMGAQGRLIEVYDDTIVMIDTFLAKVKSVSEAAYDAAGHLRKDATIVLSVYDAANTGRDLTLTNGKTNYEYAVGDYVLVNAFTNAINTAVASGAVIDNNKADILGKATSLEGSQSIIYWNATQHNVEGTIYNDAYKFLLDEADTGTDKHTWFFDSYGNLIGAVDIAAATSYGVINKIWWAGNAADGSGVAKADVTYMDGTTAQVDISEVTYNQETAGVAYTVMTGTVTHSTNYTGAQSLMKAVGGYFYVDSYATENARIDPNGILNGHLFQFTTKANGTLKAIEVSGNGQAIAATSTTSAIPAGFYSATQNVWKDTQYNGGDLIINANTVFLIRSGSSTYSFKSVTGFNNIDNYNSAEVDFVDLNKDGIADYVYIIASTEASKVTSLFYYDVDQAYYTNATKTWTIPGYIDGVKGEIYATGYTNDFVTAIKSQVNPTLYRVALADKYVATYKSTAASAGTAAAYTQLFEKVAELHVDSIYSEQVSGQTVHKTVVGFSGTDVDGASYEYKLASVYAGWTVQIDSNVNGAKDTFDGLLYTYYDASNDAIRYSVSGNGTDGITKLVGAFANGSVADQDAIVVFNAATGAGQRVMLQGYVADKSAKITNGIVTSTTIGLKTGAALGQRMDSVKFTATGFGTNIAAAGVTLDVVSVTWQRQWLNTANGQLTWVDCTADELFQAGVTYQATITIGVPSAQYSNISISPENLITYPFGTQPYPTAKGVTIKTDAFSL